MNPSPTLNGAHLRTYKTVFQHPVSHNLGWHDVHALFRQLGSLDEEPNGNFKATRNGQTLILPAPRSKDVSETDEVIRIRTFLTRTEDATPKPPDPEGQWLLVINHHEARIFRSREHGAVPLTIRPDQVNETPSDPSPFTGFLRSQEKPAAARFFGPVADALYDAAQILVFGSGTGTASEMEQFIAWLAAHRPCLMRRVIGTLRIDEHHLSDDQLLAKARVFRAAAQHPKG